jgi:crotonobetainyl-CoA:carnitine CoA-transferase CaiB-like acyl-CoA transferase
MARTLDGIRVIDWTIYQQGPVATMMLADLGAEVIKIEDRRGGDPGRGVMGLGGLLFGASGTRNFYFEANNRHKKSITLDLKKPQARDVVYGLVAKSDVFVQNFRKGVAARLGLDYATLSRHNPKLIYASASGYGPFGPDSGEPSFDYLGLARSGIMMAAGEPDMPPLNIQGGIADQMGAILLAYGVLAALVVRERQGVGQEVDASHLGSMSFLQGLNLACRAITGKAFKRMPRAAVKSALWNHYCCADGKWIALAMAQQDRYWTDFCRVLGISEVTSDPRFATIADRAENARELVAILDGVFASRPRDEWLKIFRTGGDFIYTPVNAVADLPDDPQMTANDYLVDYDHPRWGKVQIVGMPVRLGETPGNPKGAAPELGEHTEAILTELLGYSWEEIAHLKEAEVI